MEEFKMTKERFYNLVIMDGENIRVSEPIELEIDLLRACASKFNSDFEKQKEALDVIGYHLFFEANEHYFEVGAISCYKKCMVSFLYEIDEQSPFKKKASKYIDDNNYPSILEVRYGPQDIELVLIREMLRNLILEGIENRYKTFSN